MAGHSKWANIKHKKARADAVKGKVFSRVTKEIISAVRQGGPDPKTNPKLRLSIQKAKAVNLPNENIERNIKKAANKDQSDFFELVYELYGHGGVGILVEVMTDNKNRIASDMRIATNKRGGTVATPGSVSFNFDKKGVLSVPSKNLSEDEVFEQALESGAEEIEHEEETFIITTEPDDLYLVKEHLEEGGLTVDDSSIVWVPKTCVDCDAETKKLNEDLISWLEELDDVDEVFHNMNP